MSLSGYSYYRSITIDHTKCGTADSSSFTVIFSGTYSWLATVANSGHVQSSSGYDIVFSTDQSTVLNFERVSWSASTGACQFRVNITTVSHTSDTVLYVYYGNSSITTDQQNASAAYDAHYMLMAHLEDNAATTNIVDSTSHAYNLTNAANTSTKTTTGEIGSGLTYNGTSDYSHVGYQANLNTAKFTVSVWAKISGGAGTYRALASSRDASGSASKGWILYANSSNQFSAWTGMNDGGGDWSIYSNSSTITNGTWYKVDFVYDGTNTTLYVNGSSVASGAATYVQNATYELRLGAGQNESTASFFFNGVLDEFSYADTNRASSWITTAYNNESSPATFYTVGSEQNNAVSATKSVGSRFLQAINKTRSVGARFLQAVNHTQNVPSRLRLAVNHTQSVRSRLRLAINRTQSSASRLRLAINATKSVGARFRQAIARTQSVGSRLRLANNKTRSTPVRFLLAMSANRASQVRFLQAIAKTRSVGVRLRLGAFTFKSTASRLRQAVPRSQSSGVRFRKANNATRYTSVRLLLATQRLASSGVRFRRGVNGAKSTGCRFVLSASAYAPPTNATLIIRSGSATTIVRSGGATSIVRS